MTDVLLLFLCAAFGFLGPDAMTFAWVLVLALLVVVCALYWALDRASAAVAARVGRRP
jgi:hypothetical protein